MKTIDLTPADDCPDGRPIDESRRLPNFTPAAVLYSALEQSPEGATLSVMRKRMRVQERIEAAVKTQAATIDLEDEDYDTLLNTLNGTKWTICNRWVLAAVDAVFNAKAPEAA